MSDLRDHIADLLTDAEHEFDCALLIGDVAYCDCLVSKLRKAVCQCKAMGPTGEDIDTCPSCEASDLRDSELHAEVTAMVAAAYPAPF